MKRTYSQRDDDYGQIGIIESVSLRNFMCHDNLSFDFDPHMNFIVGRNGSGKSAVLTAIILALGGKSGATGRYSNIKGFIKTGKHSATVSVTLKNCGDEAYKPEEFGRKITVERYFTSEGISSYKIKSQSGQIISTSKEELINILTIMDIQIENPITVLTQETSRSFLVSKNSKADKLFQLFFKGTGLAKVHEDYSKGLQKEKEMKQELEKKKAILPDMEKEIKKLKSLLDKSSKVTELKKELMWAGVIEFEKTRDESKEALEKVEKDFLDLKNKLRVLEAELAKAQQGEATVKDDKKASQEKIEKVRKDLKVLTDKRSTLSSEIRQIQGAYLSHERQLKKFTKDIESVETIINDIKMKNESDLHEDKQRHELLLRSLSSDIENKKHQIQKLEEKKLKIRESIDDAQRSLDSCHTEFQEMNYLRENVHREKLQLIQGMSNRISVFGQEMVNLLQDVKLATQANAFLVEPKGPLGLFINVKQPEWNFTVQECLKGAFLRTFICDNAQDSNTLTRILNKHFPRPQNRPSIIISKFVHQVYDVTPHKTVCNHPTLLDMLDTIDPVITNCLIDQKQIENILLIADETEARKLMLYNPPRNCKFAYTPNGDQYCHSPYRNYSCRNKNQVLMLKTVNEDDIRLKEQELYTLDAAMKDKLKQKENFKHVLKNMENDISKIDSEITDLKIKLKNAFMRIKDEESTYEEPRDIDGLKSDLEQLQIEKQNHEEQCHLSKSLLDQKTQESNALDGSINELQRVLQIESRNYHSLCEKDEEYANKKEKFDSTIKKINDRIRNVESVLKEKKDKLANDEATLLIATRNASETCDRINTRRSPETIRQILSETEKFIQQQRKCDKETILKEYEEKVQNLSKKKAELEELEKLNGRIKSMLRKRLQEFRRICNNTSVSLTCCFSLMLKENNFRGHPIVDFDNQTLEIIAKPQKSGSTTKEAANLTQLSGGERSYVTIAFLLSLWDRINMPFRILDEYDVFMDSNNRHLSINLLVNTAKTKKKVQYIFLSPLELPDIEDSDHVKVHKMPAPRN